MAMPRKVRVVDIQGKEHYADTFDEPLFESQREYFETAERRMTRGVRLGTEMTPYGDITWQVVVHCLIAPWAVLMVIDLVKWLMRAA